MKPVKLSYQLLYTIWICFTTFDYQLKGVYAGAKPEEVQRYLDLGLQMLARGQLHDALAQFHVAIDKDPENYLSFYRRATVLLALSRGRSALQDFNKVIQLKPEMTAARMQRANVHFKMGELDLAHIDSEEVLRRDPNHKEASELYSKIDPLRQMMISAKEYYEQEEYHQIIQNLDYVVEECPWATWAREMRAEVNEKIGDLQRAVSDLRVTTKLTPDNTAGLLKLSQLYYKLGDPEQTLKEVRECLKLDPDHKECFKMYKKIKKINRFYESANNNCKQEEWKQCVEQANKILKEETNEKSVQHLAYEKLCLAERKRGYSEEAKKACDEALSHSTDPSLYCERAEANIDLEELDKAEEDFREALNMDENFQRAKEGMSKVAKLKKQASRRDYYKILGVKRSARKSEITKAYRKMAKKWHPDRYQGEKKEVAEKKFVDIAAAKEVLTNPELREKYDRGEDPLDPEQQKGGGNPFPHGFDPFQNFQGGGPNGGNFHFKFNF